MSSINAASCSGISMSLAAQSASVDIPSAYGSKKAHTAGGTTGNFLQLNEKENFRSMLPTPPNSISPTLPPHKPSDDFRPRTHGSSAESDVDLQEAVEHARCQDQPPISSHPLSRAALSGIESSAAITPAMLAKHPLPEILLANGPMAIRHVLSYLAQSVPGFSRIPPAKARRLVVAAFESRTGGNSDEEVEFEKVGWGRWEAKVKGQQPSDRHKAVPTHQPLADGHLSPPASTPGARSSLSGVCQFPGARRPSLHSPESWIDEAKALHDRGITPLNMAEHEADKMSLDGDLDSCPSSSSPAVEDDREDDSGDVTDEEDWARIGADALRQRACEASGIAGGSSVPTRCRRDYNDLSRKASSARLRASCARVATLPYRNLPKHHHHHGHHVGSHDHRNGIRRTSSRESYLSSPMSSKKAGPALGVLGQSPQERAAVEALLSMGSM